uniref:Uncharacterized protein n=1 Tax=Anguilla anguilla TaxID=7936 RepID=A0A0E9PM64_ANGAN
MECPVWYKSGDTQNRYLLKPDRDLSQPATASQLRWCSLG